jgi:tetratricopeptide (TPR) repeat protein
MAFGAAGKPIDPEALSSQVYLPGRQGSLQVEMLAATRRNGLVAVELKPSLPDLLSEIAAGNPIIVLQNLAFDWYPVWHYAVAIGFDLNEGSIVLRSGQERRSEMAIGTFERTWARGGYWAMLALPPARAPASVSDADYLNAVARLERAGSFDAARAAYEHALQRWPGNLVALVGLGNTAYRLGDLDGAEQAFRRATLAHPLSAAAHNNLAQILMDLGRDDEALAEARIAVGLGGPLEEVSVRTLDSIATHAGRGAQEWHQ